MPVAGSITAALPLCNQLAPNQNTLEFITNCRGISFGFTSSDGVFDLTGLNQTTADKFLYSKKGASGGPDLDNPKPFMAHVTLKDATVERLILAIVNIGKCVCFRST